MSSTPGPHAMWCDDFSTSRFGKGRVDGDCLEVSLGDRGVRVIGGLMDRGEPVSRTWRLG